MRKKPLILMVAFLMMLLVVPVMAGYGDESPESITSFSETLPDDVLFYPDAFVDDTPLFLTIGEGLFNDFNDTYVIDGLNWAADQDREYAGCQVLSNVERFSYSAYAYGHDGDGYLHIWNSTDWILLETFAETEVIHSWYNGTLDDPAYILSGNIIRLGIISEGAFKFAAVDYLQITVDYMTLADEDHYAESFTDASDWVASDVSISTDDDIATITENGGGSEGYAYYEFASPRDISGLYYEIRIESINGGGDWKLRAEDIGVTGTDLVTWTATDGTFKGLIVSHGGTTACDRLVIYIRDDSDSVEVDYFRIFPANESGWQHDGSTTYAATSISFGGSGSASMSSDGDVYHFQGTYTDYAGSNFRVDDTSTKAYGSVVYYPFFEARINASVTQDIRFRFKDEDGAYTTYLGYEETGDFTVVRINLQALVAGDYIQYVRVYDHNDGLQDFYVDYLGIYSIANFTITEGNPSITDYIYVDSGSMVFERNIATYFILDYDPALSFSTWDFPVWNLTVSNVKDDVGASYDWQPRFYVDGEWQIRDEDQDKTRGGFDTAGTCTDFKFVNYESMTISAIKFIDTYDWQSIGDVTVWFEIPIFTGVLDAILIFLGLIMIPASTLYLVKGGKSEMSNDKLFYGLVAFAIGWALFLGGIYG